MTVTPTRMYATAKQNVEVPYYADCVEFMYSNYSKLGVYFNDQLQRICFTRTTLRGDEEEIQEANVSVDTFINKFDKILELLNE